MPFFQREAFQIGLLLVCVPLQFYLTANTGGAMGRSQAVFKTINEIKWFYETWFSLDEWKFWWIELVYSSFKDVADIQKNIRINTESSDILESPAIEVLQYKERTGYFASSSVPRTSRPSHLRYYVGQVIKHKKLGIIGTVIGWDLFAKAPDSWLKYTYGSNSTIHTSSPHYSILVDEQYGGYKVYISQEDMEVLKDIEVHNDELYDYFEDFNGTKYIPKSHLKEKYPLD